MVITRRALVLLLTGSFLATLALAVAALVHQPAASAVAAATAPAAPSDSFAVEAGLWLGFGLVLAIFGVTFLAFRREVQMEKERARSKRERNQFLRQVREYELGRRGLVRRNN